MKRDRRHILFGLSDRDYSLKGLWLLALLYFGSLLAATFISLIAWQITHSLDPEGTSYLASKPYPRFFDRARWLSILLILPYLFLQCRATSFKAVGFSRPFANLSSKWFAYGIGMIALIYLGTFSLGAIELKAETTFGGTLRDIPGALLAGIAIGFPEEIVFRGLVFRMFYTAMRPTIAVIASSAFFAALHFRATPNVMDHIPPDQVGLKEGFTMGWETIASLVTQFDFTYLAAIFLVGIFLHQVFLLTHNLWACAAVHSGWVFTIKLISGGFQTSETANVFTGTTRVADGYWVIILLLVFITVIGVKLKSKGQSLTET